MSAYAKKFRTDLLCAVRELRMLNIEITPEYETVLKATLEGIAHQRQQAEENKQKDNLQHIDQDETFVFIAGYTSSDFPYGMRWDELTDINPGTF